MNRVQAFLDVLTAADVMRPLVVTIPQEMTLRGAARLLARYHCGGVPITDRLGRCVGALTEADLLNWTVNGGQPVEDRSPASCAWSDWQILDQEAVRKDEVGRHLRGEPITVVPETSLTEVVRLMLDTRTHLVIVVDERRRPVGVVSSMDILVAVAFSERRQSEPDSRPASGRRAVRPASV
jgi:CBS domain-containing protein